VAEQAVALASTDIAAPKVVEQAMQLGTQMVDLCLKMRKRFEYDYLRAFEIDNGM
jgi:hypothetical protein